jgi:hypothetical protein
MKLPNFNASQSAHAAIGEYVSHMPRVRVLPQATRRYLYFPANGYQEKQARTVSNDAGNALAKADRSLVKNENDIDRRYQEWFGLAATTALKQALQARIHLMNYALNNNSLDITYNQHCAGGDYASASPIAGARNYHNLQDPLGVDIDLCPSYFSDLTMRGGNSQLVTMLHEFSHAVLDSNDIPDPAHPLQPCSNAECATRLAAANPANALNNAENIAQFVASFAE